MLQRRTTPRNRLKKEIWQVFKIVKKNGVGTRDVWDLTEDGGESVEYMVARRRSGLSDMSDRVSIDILRLNAVKPRGADGVSMGADIKMKGEEDEGRRRRQRKKRKRKKKD